MKKEHLDFIKDLFPFRGIEPKIIEDSFAKVKYSIEDFSKNELIFTPDSYSKRIGFILSGECRVEKPFGNGAGMPLNTHKVGASFGILSLFNPEAEFPTSVRATKPSRILFIDGDDMISLIRSNPVIAMNFISFLAGKVSFLNKKVSAFSEKTTLGKVAAYLINEAKKSGGAIAVPKTRMAREIGIGRASLYRDLDSLEQQGIITQQPKKIIIMCSEELERKIK